MSKQVVVIFLILSIGFSACHNNKSHNDNPTKSIFNDSLYLFKITHGIVDDVTRRSELEKGIAVDSNTEKKVLTNFYPFDSSAWSIAHMIYYSKLHPVGDIQPILVYVSADDYGAIVLLNFNRQQQVVDRFALSGGICGGPDEADSFLAFCPDSHAFIFDSSHIGFYKLTSRFMLYPTFSVDSLKQGEVNALIYDSIPFIDSLSYKLEIKKDGKIVSTFLDSVRIDMHKKINSKL